MSGGADDDTLAGGPGNDAFIGGSGADRFSGGSDNDAVADLNAAEGDSHDGTTP